MSWNETYTKDTEPTLEQISGYVATDYWKDLNEHIMSTYSFSPKIEYSICSGAPGWNVKYKKGGKSLCVLYPDEGFFTCLVCIGAKEAPQAELFLSAATDYTQQLYKSVQPMNGTRWLMIKVTSEEILEDAKRLISTRVAKK